MQSVLQIDQQVMVGEIGLDKAYKRNGSIVDYDKQLTLFRDQLQLATDFQRPVSVHCVRAHGDLLQTLQAAESLPPAIALQ